MKKQLHLRMTLFMVIPAMTLPFISSIFYFVILSESDFSKHLYALTKIFTLIWPILCLLLIEKKFGLLSDSRSKFSDFKTFLKFHFPKLKEGLFWGLLALGIILISYFYTPLGSIVGESSGRIRNKVIQLDIKDHYILFTLFLSLIHSGIEEYYWRWFVFGRLKRIMSFTPAMILGSFAFASHHYVVLSEFLPPMQTAIFGTAVGFGGAFWCWLYRKQGSLAGAWLSHAFIDIALSIIGYMLIF